MIVTISTPESFVAVSWKFNPWKIVYTEYVLRLYLHHLLQMYVVKYIMQKNILERFYTLRPNLLIKKANVCVSVCLSVCMNFKKKLYIFLVNASLLRFLIIATTTETEKFLW
jgi:hypothetical protein